MRHALHVSMTPRLKTCSMRYGMIERDRDDTTPCLSERAKRNNDSLSVMGTGERQEREVS